MISTYTTRQLTAQVKKCDSINININNHIRGRGKSKLTWRTTIKKDMSEFSMSDDLALNTTELALEWRKRSHVLLIRQLHYSTHLFNNYPTSPTTPKISL